MRWSVPLMVISLLALPVSAVGQTDSAQPHQLRVVGTLLAGFDANSSIGSPAAWGVSLEVPLPETVGIKFELFERDSGRMTSCAQGSISFSCAVRESVALAGLAFNGPELGRIRPVAEAMTGRYQIGKFSTEFPVVAMGVGADIRVGSTFTYRVGLRHTRSIAGDDHPGFAEGPVRYTLATAGMRFSFGKAP